MEYISTDQDQWQGPAGQQSPIDIVLGKPRRPALNRLLCRRPGADPRPSGDQFIGAGTLTLGEPLPLLAPPLRPASTCLMASGKTCRGHFVYQDDQGQTLVSHAGDGAADGEAGFDRSRH